MTVAAPDFLPMIPRDATPIPAALKKSLRFIVHLPSSVNRHRRSHREYEVSVNQTAENRPRAGTAADVRVEKHRLDDREDSSV